MKSKFQIALLTISIGTTILPLTSCGEIEEQIITPWTPPIDPNISLTTIRIEGFCSKECMAWNMVKLWTHNKIKREDILETKPLYWVSYTRHDMYCGERLFEIPSNPEYKIDYTSPAYYMKNGSVFYSIWNSDWSKE